jgi:hypothetical protein
MIHLVTTTTLIVVIAAHSVAAQTPSTIWKSFVEEMEVGTELTMRLNDGRHFRATLVGTGESVLLVQPKTRITVPIQAVRYDEIARIERARAGIGAGKAVAIGVATGVGAFFGVLALMIGVTSD